jgi:hypothetical protein
MIILYFFTINGKIINSTKRSLLFSCHEKKIQKEIQNTNYVSN